MYRATTTMQTPLSDILPFRLAYVKNNGLTEAYEESARKFAQPEPIRPVPQERYAIALRKRATFFVKGLPMKSSSSKMPLQRLLKFGKT